MSSDSASQQAPVLDPVNRASEAIFGVLMAMTFIGTLRVAMSEHREMRTLLFAALGSSLAWGLTDAVMYLIDTATARARTVRLVRRVRTTPDPTEGCALIANELPGPLADAAGPQGLEAMRGRLLRLPELHEGLHFHDFRSAACVALLVVGATLPVVIPFVVWHDVSIALLASNVLALLTLFVSGWILGHYALDRPWRAGLAMVAVGAALVVAIIALGG
jgi:hypothetical protein